MTDAGPRWPASPSEWQARAAEVLAPEAFDYIAGGAGGEATIAANEEAFARRRLWPRVLAGHSEHDLSVTVAGTRSRAPFLLAPIGVLELAHAEAERGVARAAARSGIPMVISSAASTPLEDVVCELDGSPWWFQLWWIAERSVVESLVARAEAAGCAALVVTVDVPRRGVRRRDINHDMLGRLATLGIAQFTSDPAFRALLAQPPEEDLSAAGALLSRLYANPALSWDDLDWLRRRTSLPLLVKGVLHPADALRALEVGADGIIVSNHGGRQVDRGVAALDALLAVRAATGPDALVLMDGGVRGGGDVICALASGADAVLVGRPYVYGLAVGGEQGVAEVLRSLTEETAATLAMLGVRAATDVDGTALSPVAPG